ncbi:MAG: Non specific extracellular endonuclease cleaving [Candidatus Saccharibacteria bacterium]|nr:Non specific extracellular endonuclease cleaving [Candidatus Saccharibacteria bacterium]
MRRGINIAIVTALMCMMSGTVSADSEGAFVISEVSVGSATNSREEFIELYNGSGDYLDFSTGQWQLHIASSGAKDWQSPLRTVTLSGYLHPGYSYLIGSSFSQTTDGASLLHHFPENADAYNASALSASGGHVRLVKTDNGQASVIDEVEWGNGPTAGSLDSRTIYRMSSAIKAGRSLQRTQNDESVYIDTDDDAFDFILSDEPTPETTTPDQPPPIPPAIPETTDPGQSDDDGISLDPDVLPPRITELLPNPADPFTDASDEYIELFNPNDQAINLRGYTLQTGLTTHRTYKINTDNFIPPMAYLAFYAKQTKLSLSNTGGQARLLDPSGVVVAESAVYGKALDGLTWQNDGDIWQWSATQTPAGENRYMPPVTSLLKAVGATKKVTKPKAVKTAKKAPKKKAAKKTIQTAFVADKAPKNPTIHASVLAAVLGIALLYGAYEYRHDVANRYRQLTGNRKLGRGYWRKITRWRSDPTDQ